MGLALKRRLGRQGEEGGALWQPEQLTSARLVLRANQIPGLPNPVATWTDQTGLGGAISTAGYQPVPGVIGGEQIAQFDNSNDYILVASRTSLDFSTSSPFTLAARYYTTGVTKGGAAILYRYNTSSSQGYRMWYDSTPAKLKFDVGNLSISSKDDQIGAGWRTVVAIRDSGGSRLYVNGALQASSSTTGKNATTSYDLVSGESGSAPEEHGCAIAMLCVFAEALDDGNRGLLEAWRSI